MDKDIIQLSTVLIDEEDSIDQAGDAKNANVSAQSRLAGLSSHNIMPTRQQLLITAAYENDITLQQLLEEKEELVSSMDDETMYSSAMNYMSTTSTQVISMPGTRLRYKDMRRQRVKQKRQKQPYVIINYAFNASLNY